MVETGLNDFGEKIAKIFGVVKNTASATEESVFHECDECEYKSMHVRNLQSHMENRHKALLEEREGEKNEGKKRAKQGNKRRRNRGEGNEGWKAVKKERILELAPLSSDYIESLTLPPLQSEKTFSETLQRNTHLHRHKGNVH